MYRIYLYLILLFTLSQSANGGQAEYDDCILEHLQNAKLDVAAHLIKLACEENYLQPGQGSNKRRDYNECLLQHLSGIESLQATMDIKAACSSKYL